MNAPTDENIAARAVALLRETGPKRIKPMVAALNTSYGRLIVILMRLVKEGRLVRLPDGTRDNNTVYKFAVPDDDGASYPAQRFNAAQTLAAFQDAARRFAMGASPT
jgi:hypothetical protein